MTNAPKTVLAIHDLPGFGRAALSVIVPVLSTLGVQTVALPTAVLSTHTGGLGAPAKLADPAYGPAALAHYHRLGGKFDCIYSGYLADAAQAKLVQQAFALWPRAFKVVDLCADGIDLLLRHVGRDDGQIAVLLQGLPQPRSCPAPTSARIWPPPMSACRRIS